MSLHQKFIDQILFVIVIYKREASNCIAFRSLCLALASEGLRCSISIYDNSPSAGGLATSDQHQLFQYHNATNDGLSKSYNHAYREAMTANKRWLFLLDQDTELPPDFYMAYDLAVQQFPDEILFAPIVKDSKGILSPTNFTRGKGKRLTKEISGLVSFQKARPINSGMMIGLGAFGRVNGFEESIKLDFSDFAFIEKIKKQYKTFIILDLTLVQDFFDSSASKIDALHRFKFYCAGAFEMGRIFGPAWIYCWRAMSRSLYLSVRFKSSIFLGFFLQTKKNYN